MLGEFLSPIKVGAPTLAGHAVTLGYLQTNYAPLASPGLTGTPTAPTAAAGTSTTQIATTAFVKTYELALARIVRLRQSLSDSG